MIARKNNKIVLLIVGAMTEVVTLKQALSEDERKTTRSAPSERNLGLRSARCSKSSRLS